MCVHVCMFVSMCACLYVCMHACTYAYMHACVCLSLCVYVQEKLHPVRLPTLDKFAMKRVIL